MRCLLEKKRSEYCCIWKRLEAFNVTNSMRPGDPITNLSSGIFGQINTSSDPRIPEFALKYVF